MVDYERLDKKYVWHPFTQMKDWLNEPQLVIEEAKGCYLKDTKGRWYLDGVSSLWVNVHGHRKKEIDKAIKSQIDKLSHSTLLGLGNIPSIKLAQKLVKIAPQPKADAPRAQKGLSKVFYSDNGSTAVEVALKITFQYWQQREKSKKRKFISLVNAYHGDTIGSVSIGGIDLFHEIYKPLLFKSVKVQSPYCYRCLYNKKYPSCKIACIGELRRVITQHKDEVAALVVEPIVQAAAGMIVWPNGYLKAARELCTKNGILLIADEVATGFGRTGKMFACEHENVTPDIMTLAKGITGGYLPLAATLTTDEVYDAFLGDYAEKKTLFHGHTYTGNPLAAAVALVNIELFEKENVLQSLKPKIEFLRKGLLKFRELSHVGDIRQKGFMVGIELVKDKKTKKSYDWSDKIGTRVILEARKRNVILRPLGNVIVLMPPLAITKEGLKTLLDVTFQSIRQAADGSDKRISRPAKNLPKFDDRQK